MAATVQAAERRRQGSAVVVGASIAGLLAARALADQFDQVTVVERDQLPLEPAFGAGVPQSRHLHLLHGRGIDLYEQLLPGFGAAMTHAGAQTVAWADALWLNAAGWSRRYPSPIQLPKFPDPWPTTGWEQLWSWSQQIQPYLAARRDRRATRSASRAAGGGSEAADRPEPPS